MPHSNQQNLNEKAMEAVEAINVLKAQCLALNGNLDDAETALIQNYSLPRSPEGLDMLARIAVQKGQFSKAAKLWRGVLATDPDNAAALAALQRLNSPWVRLALLKRLAWLCLISVSFVFVFIGLLSLQSNRMLSSPYSSAISPTIMAEAKESAVDQDVKVEETSGDIQTMGVSIPVDVTDRAIMLTDDIDHTLIEHSSTSLKQIPDERVSQPHARLSPPKIGPFEGVNITTNEYAATLVFTEGLFLFGHSLRTTALDLLKSISNALVDHATDCWIIVEGHTDSVPLHPNSVFRNNYTLGLYRASVVADRIVSAEPSLAANIVVRSAGGVTTVFPEHDELPEHRNRTAVIRLIPK